MGTQLNIPSDDEDERGSKTVPIWDQVVKDEQGRRRFHGAFTGGFSAGYFNTVGSAEGWTPTQFRSSRDKPAQYRPQTVEDFMDEEDKKLLGHELATRQQFDTLDQESQKLAQKGLRRDTSKSFAGARLQDFFVVPASHSVGKQILKEMGWKEGQGVGPRLSMREKKRAEPKKTRIGFEDQLGAVFAPENAEVYRVTPKNDNYGLGFDPKRGQGDFAALGPQRLMDSTGMFAAGGSSSKGPLRMGDVLTGRTTKGPSLGMGALEDGDDYDVYGSEDISQFDRFSGPLLTEGPQEETHSDSEDDGLERPSRCADGRPPLSGFKLASIQWDKTEADIALALAGGHSGSIHVPESFVPVHQFPDLPQTNEQSVDKAVDHAVQKIQEQLKQRSSRFAPPSSAPPPDVNVWEREARPDIAQVRNEASVALDSRFVSTTTATSEEDMTGAAMAKDPKQGTPVMLWFSRVMFQPSLLTFL